MNPLFEINKELAAVEKELALKTGELNKAQEAYLFERAKYESEFAKSYLSHKATDKKLTQPEVNAMATESTFTMRLDLVKKESAYKAVLNTIKCLYAQLDSIKERSYVLRKEASL